VKTVLTINGSSRSNEKNGRLLKSLPLHFDQYSFVHFEDLSVLPLFTADNDHHPWPTFVLDLREKIKQADAVIISTPEYIFNIPAVLKNALEWISSSGELMDKPLLPITFCPHAPRGEKAMTSLLFSLQALGARIVAQLPLYQNEIVFNNHGHIEGDEMVYLLGESIQLLFS
jgi:chromate reductase, NAD(P)H dehydrogenase (quinone)